MRLFLRVLGWKPPHLLPCSQVLVVTTQLSFFSMRETFNLSDPQLTLGQKLLKRQKQVVREGGRRCPQHLSS